MDIDENSLTTPENYTRERTSSTYYCSQTLSRREIGVYLVWDKFYIYIY